MQLLSKSLLALYHGLGASLTRGKFVRASKSRLDARSANRSYLIALIDEVREIFSSEGEVREYAP